ncbi:hypothetical protein ACFFX0_26665 [Citricoccus parietis]|uniref:Uncharacterized protein n=1 Tax=Citricoccus parietis TaxID=592307 RepID=A0ABV5G833_9MICC
MGRADVGCPFGDPRMRGQLAEQLEAAGTGRRVVRDHVRLRQQNGVNRGQFLHEELTGGSLIVGQGQVAGLEERMAVPDLVLDSTRRAGQHHGVEYQ